VGTIKSKLQSGALTVALNALAVLAFGALALTPLRAVGFVLAGLTLLGVLARVRTDGTAMITAQAVTLAGILADYDRHSPHHRVPLAIAGILLIALIVNMPVVESVVNRPTIRVANLAGYQEKDGLLVSPTMLYLGNPILIALAGVFAATGTTAWPLVAVYMAAALLVGVVGLQALRMRLRGGNRERAVRAALERHEPAFALYFSAPDHTEYHVEMWRPYLERVGKPWMVVLREPQPFRTLSASMAPAGVPVLYCPLIEHVDEVVTPSLKAVLYVNNGMKNTHMVRFNSLTHIQMLHGDSDKASSFNPVTGMFDRIFVAGQAGIDRYADNGVHIPLQKFDIVGRPQVEDVRVSHDRIADIADKVVTYMTTWVGLYTDANYCSLPIGEKIVRELLERKVTVILRPHPYARRDANSAAALDRMIALLEEDKAKTGRNHLFGAVASTEMTVFDCCNQADAMISDVSSVASDFLYSGKPLALTNMPGLPIAEFERMFPLAKASYVIDKKGNNLGDVLDDMLEKDSLNDIRREVRTYYLGDFAEESYADGFVSVARKYVVGDAA